MARVAETYLNCALVMPEADQEALAAFLRTRAAELFRQIYGLDGSISVETRDGSLKIWIRAAVGLYAAVAAYGSFRSGIDYLVGDARLFSEGMHQVLTGAAVREEEISVFQRRLGVVGKIRRVLFRIERLSSDPLLPAAELHEEYADIKAKLVEILVELDTPSDQEFFIANLPEKFSGAANAEGLPGPAKLPLFPTALVSRSEDWDLNDSNGMKYVPKVERMGPISFEPVVRFDLQTGQVVRSKKEDPRLLIRE